MFFCGFPVNSGERKTSKNIYLQKIFRNHIEFPILTATKTPAIPPNPLNITDEKEKTPEPQSIGT